MTGREMTGRDLFYTAHDYLNLSRLQKKIVDFQQETLLELWKTAEIELATLFGWSVDLQLSSADIAVQAWLPL